MKKEEANTSSVRSKFPERRMESTLSTVGLGTESLFAGEEGNGEVTCGVLERRESDDGDGDGG